MLLDGIRIPQPFAHYAVLPVWHIWNEIKSLPVMLHEPTQAHRESLWNKHMERALMESNRKSTVPCMPVRVARGANKRRRNKPFHRTRNKGKEIGDMKKSFMGRQTGFINDSRPWRTRLLAKTDKQELWVIKSICSSATGDNDMQCCYFWKLKLPLSTFDASNPFI